MRARIHAKRRSKYRIAGIAVAALAATYPTFQAELVGAATPPLHVHQLIVGDTCYFHAPRHGRPYYNCRPTSLVAPPGVTTVSTPPLVMPPVAATAAAHADPDENDDNARNSGHVAGGNNDSADYGARAAGRNDFAHAAAGGNDNNANDGCAHPGDTDAIRRHGRVQHLPHGKHDRLLHRRPGHSSECLVHHSCPGLLHRADRHVHLGGGRWLHGRDAAAGGDVLRLRRPRPREFRRGVPGQHRGLPGERQHVGDTVTVTLAEEGGSGTWSVTFTDRTTGWSSSTTATPGYDAAGSAGFVVEADGQLSSGAYLPQTNFGSLDSSTAPSTVRTSAPCPRL